MMQTLKTALNYTVCRNRNVTVVPTLKAGYNGTWKIFQK